jgi:hypothetical protein
MDGEGSPFTPAEMYLSDLLIDNGDDAIGFCVGVDENVIYRPSTNDPLGVVSVQDKLIASLNEMRLPTSGEYPLWMRSLTREELEMLKGLSRMI